MTSSLCEPSHTTHDSNENFFFCLSFTQENRVCDFRKILNFAFMLHLNAVKLYLFFYIDLLHIFYLHRTTHICDCNYEGTCISLNPFGIGFPHFFLYFFQMKMYHPFLENQTIYTEKKLKEFFLFCYSTRLFRIVVRINENVYKKLYILY